MKHLVATVLTVLLCSFLFPVQGFAGVTNYTNGNQILSLAVDGDTLLAGTEGGLVIWDLKSKTYRKITTLEALPNNKVTSIVVDKSRGVWWFGTHRGVCRYDDRKWTSYGVKNGLNSMWINQLYLDDEGIIWAAGRRGVNWFDNYKWNSLFENKENDPALVYGLAKDKADRWWFTDRGKGIFLLESPFKLTRFERVHNIPSDFTRRVVVDGNGTLWFGTYRGVISYDGGAWVRYGQAQGLTSLQINAIFIDHTNTPWAGTPHGASRLVEGKWAALSHEHGLPDNYVTSFAEDENGNLYIGTKNGIAVYNGEKIARVLRTDDPVRGITFTDAVMQKNGTLWFSSVEGGGLLSYDGKEWRHYGTKDGLADNDLLCLAVDHDDTVWAGGHRGASKFASGTWTSITTEDGLAGNNVYAIAFQGERILFGTNEGLSILEKGRWTTYTREHGLPHNTVLSVLSDNDLCFVGTQAGLAVLKESKPIPVESLSGLPVTALLKTKDGTLLIGTDSGLIEMKDGNIIRKLGIRDGLEDLRVEDLTLDREENLWVATQRGLCKYNGEKFVCFTRDYGFADDHILAAAVDQDGTKWLATAQGITRFDDRLRFDYREYIGLAGKALITLEEDRLNKNPQMSEEIPLLIRNVTTGENTEVKLKEQGVNTGSFQTEIRFSTTSGTERENSVRVDADKTNFLQAAVPARGTAPITARAFWHNDFITGNINGDAIVSRQDAILADQILSGLSNIPMPRNSDYNHDGVVDQEDIAYAKGVNSGEIHPWEMVENQGPRLRPRISAALNSKVSAFSPQDLPWLTQKVRAETGASLNLSGLTLEIPPGALEQDTLITITQAERTPSPSDVHVYPVGTGFNIYPAGLAFKKPVKLTFKVYEADLLFMAVGCWNGNAYDALPSYPYFRESRIVGFIHALPDNLERPDRPAHAMTRTAPVENYQYPSNYFSLITIKEAKPIILGERPAGFTIDIGESHGIDPARLFVIDGKNERLLLDVDGIAADKGSRSLTHLMETGTILTNEWNGVPLPQGVPHRIGIIGKDPKANRTVLASAFYAAPPLNLSAVKIFPEEAKLAENSELRFIGIGISSDGTEISGLPFSWSVEGPEAKVDSFGSLTSKGEQKARVQVSYAGLSARAKFQVKGKSVLTDILFAPQVQVVRVNEERDYQAIGVDQYGHRMEFEPEWSIRQDGGDGEINSKTGHFTAKKEGLYYLRVAGGTGISKQVISFIGTCTWCHFKGR